MFDKDPTDAPLNVESALEEEVLAVHEYDLLLLDPDTMSRALLASAKKFLGGTTAVWLVTNRRDPFKGLEEIEAKDLKQGDLFVVHETMSDGTDGVENFNAVWVALGDAGNIGPNNSLAVEADLVLTKIHNVYDDTYTYEHVVRSESPSILFY